MAARSDVADPSRELDELLFRLGQALRRLRVGSGERPAFTYAIGAGFWQLVTIAHYGAVRVSELASALNLDVSTVSRQLKVLEQRGLVRKVTDEGDARVARVQLTDEGRDILDQLRRSRHEVLAQALASWPPERRSLLFELLGELVTSLDAATALAGPHDEVEGPAAASANVSARG